MSEEPRWLKYAKKLQSIAQAGLEYSSDKYDRERFQQIREISVDILEHYTEIDSDKIKKLFTCEEGYQTPKIDVRAAVIKNNKILLVKEKIDGLWSLPGGWADIDLSLSENLIKEAVEEAGAEIVPKRIIAVLDRNDQKTPPCPYSIYKIFVECSLKKIDFQENMETSAADFFSKDNLPELSEKRNTYKEIEMCFETAKKDTHEALFK